MSYVLPVRIALAVAAVAALSGLPGGAASGQMPAPPPATPINDLPNQYQTVENYFKLPDGRKWGSTSAVDIDRDGRSIWVGERCGANSCAGSTLDPVLKFDASGKLVKSFGSGMIVFAHGIHVDRDGNIWVTDGQDNRPRRAPGAPPNSPLPPAPAKLIGQQVFKFSPEGKVLLTLGTAGVAGNPPEAFTEPNDVATAPNGDIFVAEGHNGQNENATPATIARISKFTKDGKFIKSWGKLGAGPGEFRTPHALAFDSRGRLYVGDRGNHRLQVFDQDGKFIEETKNFSRLSGIYIRNDILYGTDSESNDSRNMGWKRGIRIGSAKDFKVTGFIPDPDPKGGTSFSEGVAVDSAGNIYGAEVGPMALKKYVKK